MKVVYLHGFASAPSSRKAQFFRARFASLGITLDVPDLTPSPEEGGFEALSVTGQLRTIERTIQGEPAALIGSSLGGYLAALYASAHPETSRIVLMAPAFSFARRWRERLGPDAYARWLATGYLSVFHFGQNRELRVGRQLIDDGGRYPDFPPVDQPALIFHGRKDDIVPLEFSQQFANKQPNVDLHVLDSGHELTDCLDYMWEHTSRFLLPRR